MRSSSVSLRATSTSSSPILVKVDFRPLRDRPLGEAHAGELGDVLGDVAHALERRADPQRAHDDAQVARDRLLAGEDLDRQLVERDGLLVDDGVGLDDLFGQRDVARAERPRGLVDGDRDELGDLDETSLDVLERLMEDFAHCSTFRVPQQARRLATLAIVAIEG